MKVIKAKIEHLDKIAPLFNQYRVFYEQESDLEKARDFIQERLNRKESTILIAIDTNEKAVGFTQLFPSFSSVSCQRTFILNDLYVDKESRKAGIGSLLLNAVKDLAIELNYKGVALETARNNPAQKLYESLDWQKDKDHYFYFWSNKD